ncbi:hypothetical protein ACUOFC_61940, partial [Escherichia sp. TWPC-MK]
QNKKSSGYLLFCESYDYKCNEMEKRFIVDPDDNIGVFITYDQTDWFGRHGNWHLVGYEKTSI